jgi:hypothetical protein
MRHRAAAVAAPPLCALLIALSMQHKQRQQYQQHTCYWAKTIAYKSCKDS